MTAFILRYNKE